MVKNPPNLCQEECHGHEKEQWDFRVHGRYAHVGSLMFRVGYALGRGGRGGASYCTSVPVRSHVHKSRPDAKLLITGVCTARYFVLPRRLMPSASSCIKSSLYFARHLTQGALTFATPVEFPARRPHPLARMISSKLRPQAQTTSPQRQ